MSARTSSSSPRSRMSTSGTSCGPWRTISGCEARVKSFESFRFSMLLRLLLLRPLGFDRLGPGAARRHFNPAGSRLGRFGHQDFEDAVLERGADLFLVDVGRHRQGPEERSGRTLLTL